MLDPGAMTPYYDIALAKALRDIGADVRLITSRYLYEPDVPLADEIADHFFFRAMESHARFYSRLPWLRRAIRLLSYPFDWLRLLREFSHDSPDIIHIQWTWLPAIDRLPIRKMTARVPLVLTVHDPEPRAASMTHLADMRPLYNLAKFLIVHAEENRETLMRRSLIDLQRVRVIPLGPLLPARDAPPRAAAREQLSISVDAEVVLFFGVIKPNKGLLDLIAAMPALLARRPNTHLLIAGRPEGVIEPYLQAATSAGINEHVTFYTSFIASALVPLYFSASDVVCLPYRQASQSMVLLTAYQFGRPVVVTRVGGLPESVEEGQNGFVVPPADPAALADALARLLAEPGREHFGQRSLQLAHGPMSWDRAARLTLGLYNEILSSRH